MAQTRKKTASKPPPSKKTTAARGKSTAAGEKTPRRREIGAVVCLLLSVFTFIGYFSGGGVFIGFFRDLLRGLVGVGFFAFPPILLLCAVTLTFHRGRPVAFRVTCTVLLTAILAALLHLFSHETPEAFSFRIPQLWADGQTALSGGVVGGTLAELSSFLFSRAGAAAVFICLGIFLLLAAFNKTLAGIFDAVKSREKREYIPAPEPPERPAPPIPQKRTRRVIDIPLDEPEPPPASARADALYEATPRVKTPEQALAELEPQSSDEPVYNPEEYGDVPLDIAFMEKKGKTAKKRAASEPAPEFDPPKPEKPTPDAPPPADDYSFPPITLLASGASSRVDGSEEVRINSERLEASFRSFGVTVKISNTTRGPSVTRYEAELEAGVKLSRLTSLADDIALSLGTSGVRISAMQDKISTVGIEVPNKLISRINLREIIDSPEFRSAPSRLTFAIGKNISGESIVGNISKLPHMLVAGTTGSGKSVCLNSLILSILYKATPDDVRFIMIDPKMVEFRIYNGIPHLLVPVVTDVKKASGALQWAVVEMEKRYRLFSETNARDLESYNKLMKKDGEPAVPQIIIVIDELADLMMTAKKEVEESIIRLAQKGRAAGLHLVIATQSPRADVITGLMKANIPSRIALKVSSSLESRIILDAGGGADKLVGNGDMLYAPSGANKPMRVQGTWVSDSERESVVEYIKKRGETQYSDDVISEIDRAAEDKKSPGGEQGEDAGDYDELLPQAAEVILETKQASVSMLQRRLRLGYARAARIVDQLEQIGVVGPFEGSKPRQILLTRQQWQEMQYISGTAPADSFLSESDAPDDSEEDGDAPF